MLSDPIFMIDCEQWKLICESLKSFEENELQPQRVTSSLSHKSMAWSVL